MSDTADRYRKLAAAFTERVRAVPSDAWDQPAPCEGWVARDVVRHMIDTAGFFLGRAGVEIPVTGDAADDDPVGAWEAVRDTVQAALDDPNVAGTEVQSPMGTSTVEQLMARFGVPDVLIHTWDLSRAAGLDETLDTEEVARVYEAMLPADQLLRQGTAFGPKVDVPEDADLQTKLIAFTGRHP